LDSVHIWRLGIYSLTVYCISAYGHDLRERLINRSKTGADLWAEGLGRPAPHVAFWQSGDLAVLQRRPRTISMPARNERCTGKNARQGAHTQ
jgi:hypothetical protein